MEGHAKARATLTRERDEARRRAEANDSTIMALVQDRLGLKQQVGRNRAKLYNFNVVKLSWGFTACDVLHCACQHVSCPCQCSPCVTAHTIQQHGAFEGMPVRRDPSPWAQPGYSV